MSAHLPGTRAFYVYWIVSDQRSYIGACVDPARRLRQHNSLLSGGARRTRGRVWHYKCVIRGFRTWREALQMEWAFKFHSRRCRSVAARQVALEGLMKRERWTSNAPLASEVPLEVEYDPTCYGTPQVPGCRAVRSRTREKGGR
jgi:predicted GIY-YIG superfamily endonuclease